MKRYLIQQMLNEWRSNLWMVIEISVVSVILWAIFSFFAQIVTIRTQDYGYDTNDVLVGNLKAKSTDFGNMSQDEIEKIFSAKDNLIANLKGNPYVEEVGYGTNALPYNLNFEGKNVWFKEDTTVYYMGGNARYISPSVIRILRLKSLDGKTTEELAEVLKKDAIILGHYDEMGWNPGWADINKFLNRETFIDDDSTRRYFVGGLAKSIHRTDYEPMFQGTVYFYMSPGNWPREVIIRVKQGKAKEFLASLKSSDVKLGDVYLSDIKDLKNLADVVNLKMDNMVRNAAVCAGFMLLVVFLGFLGTFWFRTQQRVPEIAVRKVNGATRGDVFRRLISESMIMLAISLVVAAVVAVPVMKSDVLNFLIEDNTTAQFVYGAIATVVVLMIMIVAGVWFPARTAMNVNPADALKDQ